MIKDIGEKYLITTNDWFYAPDGESYKAVYGTVRGIYSDAETLGIKTNARSTNWYVEIGNMLVAGCQIFYAIKTDKVNLDPGHREFEHNGMIVDGKLALTRIYYADVR